MLTKTEGISQSLLYHLELYPIGFQRKNIIMRKLLVDSPRDNEHSLNSIKDEKYATFLKNSEIYEQQVVFQDQSLIRYNNQIVEALILALQRVDLTDDMR